jgi:hypothetical protein
VQNAQKQRRKQENGGLIKGEKYFLHVSCLVDFNATAFDCVGRRDCGPRFKKAWPVSM